MKTSLKVSVALALTAAFASTGAMAEASKEFGMTGFARYDLTNINVDGGDTTFGDGHRIQLNAVGKGTNSRGQFVKGVGQIRLNNDGFAMADAYVQAGNQRVNVQAGRFYDMSVWDERGTEKFVSEGSISGVGGQFYTAESPRNGNNEAHVAVNYTPSDRTKAQLSLRHGTDVDYITNTENGVTARGKLKSTTQIRPAISYDSGRYQVAAAYKYAKREMDTTDITATGYRFPNPANIEEGDVLAPTTLTGTQVGLPSVEQKESGFVASVGSKFSPNASASLNLAHGKFKTTTALNNNSASAETKRKSVGISGTYKQVDAGIISSKDTAAGAADQKTTAVYADWTRPLMGIKGAKTVVSAFSAKTKQDGTNDQKATGLNARLQYNF